MRRYWTTVELRELRTLYPDTGNKALGQRFGRKPKAIALLALKLGLRKSPQFMAQHCRYRLGHATWNKGKPWSPPGSAATRFKKGQRGPRQRPVGAERVERDSVYVKVAEPNVWEAKARIVWEQHFGKIPSGGIVRLKDGDKLNCAPENLTLITRQENARLNAAIRRPRRKPVPRWIASVLPAQSDINCDGLSAQSGDVGTGE